MISQGIYRGIQGFIHSTPSQLPGNAVCEEHPEAEAPTAQAGGTGNEPEVFWMAGPARGGPSVKLIEWFQLVSSIFDVS